MIVKEDVQIIEDMFKLLNDVTFEKVDADKVLQYAHTMKRLAQLQKKMQDIVNKPEFVPEVGEQTKPKKKKESK